MTSIVVSMPRGNSSTFAGANARIYGAFAPKELFKTTKL